MTLRNNRKCWQHGSREVKKEAKGEIEIGEAYNGEHDLVLEDDKLLMNYRRIERNE